MEQKILEILQDIKPGVDFATETDFIESGVIDSFDVITLVGEFGEAFGVSIGVLDLDPSNFKDIASIKAMIERLTE